MMKSGKEQDITKNLAILIQGSPKTGKTEQACLFPTPCIINCDNNLSGFTRRQKEQNFDHEWYYIDILKDDTGKEVPLEQRWKRLIDACKEAGTNPKIRTIVIDSMSTALLYGCEGVVQKRLRERTSKNRSEIMSLEDWQPFYSTVKNWVIALRSCGKIIVALSHEETETDELAGGIVKWWPNVPGKKLQQSFTGYFSDGWRTEVSGTGKDLKYITRVKPTPRLDLGGSIQNKEETFERPDSLFEQRKQLWNLLGFSTEPTGDID